MYLSDDFWTADEGRKPMYEDSPIMTLAGQQTLTDREMRRLRLILEIAGLCHDLALHFTFDLEDAFGIKNTHPLGYNIFDVSNKQLVEWLNTTEYEQIAMGYRQQNGQSGEANATRIRQFANTSKCWLCGRVATGEGIHFFSAPAEVSGALEKESAGGVAKSSPADGQHIYICRACYTAVSNRADDISKVYFDRGMAELRATEARLQAEIAALESQIAFARMGR